jgi:H+/gluconate symporter-like permease
MSGRIFFFWQVLGILNLSPKETPKDTTVIDWLEKNNE